MKKMLDFIFILLYIALTSENEGDFFSPRLVGKQPKLSGQ